MGLFASGRADLFEQPVNLNLGIADGAHDDELLGFARLSRAQIDAFLNRDLPAGAETPAFAIGKLEQDAAALGRRYADVGVDVEADGERQAPAPCLRYGREAVAAC